MKHVNRDFQFMYLLTWVISRTQPIHSTGFGYRQPVCSGQTVSCTVRWDEWSWCMPTVCRGCVPGYSRKDSTGDSLNTSGPLQLFISPIVPAHPTSKFLDLYKGHALTPRTRVRKSGKMFLLTGYFRSLFLVILVFSPGSEFLFQIFQPMIQALLNNNLTNQIVRDENILVQRASVFLSVAFHLIGALFLYFVSIDLGWNLGGLTAGFSRFLFLR